MDGLEVDGDVVNSEEEGAGKDEGKGAHDPDGSVLDDSGGNHGSLALVPLEDSPSNDDEAESDEETNDDGGVESVSLATVLSRQDVRNGCTHHQRNTQGVHLSNLLQERSLLGDGVARSLEEDEDDEGRDTTDGEVDVEAPSPRDVIGKGAADEGTDDTGDSVGGADDAGEGGSLLRGRGEGDDGVGAGAETGGSHAGDGAAGDEGLGVGGGAADDGAELEDEDGDEEGCLEGEVLVDFTPCMMMLVSVHCGGFEVMVALTS